MENTNYLEINFGSNSPVKRYQIQKVDQNCFMVKFKDEIGQLIDDIGQWYKQYKFNSQYDYEKLLNIRKNIKNSDDFSKNDALNDSLGTLDLSEILDSSNLDIFPNKKNSPKNSEIHMQSLLSNNHQDLFKKNKDDDNLHQVPLNDWFCISIKQNYKYIIKPIEQSFILKKPIIVDGDKEFSLQKIEELGNRKIVIQDIILDFNRVKPVIIEKTRRLPKSYEIEFPNQTIIEVEDVYPVVTIEEVKVQYEEGMLVENEALCETTNSFYYENFTYIFD